MSPERFKQIRDTFGLTQSELAACFGLTQKTVSQYEIGFRVPGPTVRVIMLVLERLSVSQATKLLNLMNKVARENSNKRSGKNR